MGRLDKGVLIAVSPELAAWLEQKERIGYKRTTFARYVIEQYVEAEKAGKVTLLETLNALM